MQEDLTDFFSPRFFAFFAAKNTLSGAISDRKKMQLTILQLIHSGVKRIVYHNWCESRRN